jgi:hypothetical protein
VKTPNEQTIRRMTECLKVDGDKLVWTKPPRNHQKSREGLAGYLKPEGYIVVNIGKFCWYAHRIVWLLEKGYWPVGQIDHIDGNRSNNSIDNLREVTAQENSVAKKKVNNKATSKYRGVSFNTRLQKWVCSLTYKSEKHYLGLFDNEYEAALAFNEKAKQIGFFQEGLNQVGQEKL